MLRCRFLTGRLSHRLQDDVLLPVLVVREDRQRLGLGEEHAVLVPVAAAGLARFE